MSRTYKDMLEASIQISKSDRIRKGKTQKDLRSGAFKRNDDNKLARASWSREAHGAMTRSCPGGTRVGDFPIHTCNGKKSRLLRNS